ncbi:Hypothetical protein SRAE_1000030400 [Strongyloides ratti]|uniref:Uncharacterized protein n=1 Tax=Strongyloides ratti TaxID=34506 RepID=A0A090MU68_STRRB|nr:Hypothetical protein SRAE_1000030400 [Strongyloides ratti]CEF62028.1 Hypothetical protein SRAE_1000030400 [Strongyloides ratti]
MGKNDYNKIGMFVPNGKQFWIYKNNGEIPLSIIKEESRSQYSEFTHNEIHETESLKFVTSFEYDSSLKRRVKNFKGVMESIEKLKILSSNNFDNIQSSRSKKISQQKVVNHNENKKNRIMECQSDSQKRKLSFG